MANRRFFLLGSSSLFLSQFLPSCGNSRALKIALLQGSIPPQLVKKFQQAIPSGKEVVFQPESQLKKIYESFSSYDLATLGDAWLATAIQDDLIQPLNLETLPNWSKLPQPWQDLVRRDSQGHPHPTGKLWGSPYRWGGTLIVYRQDKFRDFNWIPTDWSDLWREDIAHRLSLLDQPREVIGLTLKSLGYSYNTPNLSEITPLKSRLLSLHKQVKFYSSDYYLQPLLLGDTWLAVGWSGDILPVVASNPNLKVVMPKSGTSLWSDIWVKPTTSVTASDTLPSWMNFCWESESAHLISLLTHGLSPLILTTPVEEIPQNLLKNPFLGDNKALLDKSEFLYPLSSPSQAEYEKLWLEMRLSRTAG